MGDLIIYPTRKAGGRPFLPGYAIVLSSTAELLATDILRYHPGGRCGALRWSCLWGFSKAGLIHTTLRLRAKRRRLFVRLRVVFMYTSVISVCTILGASSFPLNSAALSSSQRHDDSLLKNKEDTRHLDLALPCPSTPSAEGPRTGPFLKAIGRAVIQGSCTSSSSPRH